MATESAKRGQDRTPTWAVAVFGQDTPITGPPDANDEAWKSANLQFTDPDGYTLNTASFGAGAWQLTAADYDALGNPVRVWTERATAGIRDGSLPGGGAADQVAIVTAYNDDITNTAGAVITPAGSLVTDTYSPVREVIAEDGSLALLRTRTHTNYDQGAPNGGINPDTSLPYRLPTQVTVTGVSTDGRADGTLSSILTGYDALVAGDTTGWALGQATTNTSDMDLDGTVSAGDITSRTRYDNRGRVIESRQPKSDGTDAGTRVTTYYSGATSSVSGCENKPAWAGMPCRVGPAAQPTGQTIPVTATPGTCNPSPQPTPLARSPGPLPRVTTRRIAPPPSPPPCPDSPAPSQSPRSPRAMTRSPGR